MLSSNTMLCAEGIVRDVESNNISIFNVLEEVSSTTFPIYFQRFFVFAAAGKSGDDSGKPICNLDVRLNGDLLLSLPFTLDFQGKPRTKTIISIGGLVVPTSGILRTAFVCDQQEINSCEIAVKRIEGLSSAVQ